jgi:hypothetical protein
MRDFFIFYGINCTTVPKRRMFMSVTITEKKIKSKIRLGERVAIIENIKYPQFEGDKDSKLCKRMNAFYTFVAEKYSSHARNKLPQRIKLQKCFKKLPFTLSMNYTAVFCREKIISIVLDLAFSEGKKVKTRRFSQMWSIENEDIIPVYDVLAADRGSEKKLYSLVADAAKENFENPAFGYYEDSLTKLRKNFDVRNCFAVPEGICFFVNAGILSPVKYGSANFVLPYDELEGILKDVF